MPRTLFPALVAAALLLGACGGVDSPPSAVEPASPAPVTSSEPAPAATTSAAPEQATTRTPHQTKQHSRGKVAPSALPMARPDGSRGHLLAPTTLPSYDAASDESAWTITATGPERTRPVGACQKATFVDIGALHAVRRGFAGPEGPDGSVVRVRQVVARFADAKSAWRAHQVLRSWRDDCEEWLDHPQTDVGPMEDVKTATGTAGAYRASYGTKKDTAASGLGIVRQGRWLSVIALSKSGEDYPAAWTRKAVRRIAATF